LVIVRAKDSQLPHITPATKTYSMMLTNWTSFRNDSRIMITSVAAVPLAALRSG
jgi:hypothetical protein